MTFDNNTTFEKKVFFLNPPNIIREEIVLEIIKNEYEAYIVDDHEKLKDLLKIHNESILFINIDSVLKTEEWIKYIKDINMTDETKDVRMGVLTFNENKELEETFERKKFLKCGYIRLKLGVNQSKQMILKTLEENDAKGRRKFIRVHCENNSIASFNIDEYDVKYDGNIDYISSVGMACKFNDMEKDFDIRYQFKDIQLRLLGSVCKVAGTIFGIRNDEEKRKKAYVIMFENIDSQSKDKIHRFILKMLQRSVKEEMDKF